VVIGAFIGRDRVAWGVAAAYRDPMRATTICLPLMLAGCTAAAPEDDSAGGIRWEFTLNGEVATCDQLPIDRVMVSAYRTSSGGAGATDYVLPCEGELPTLPLDTWSIDVRPMQHYQYFDGGDGSQGWAAVAVAGAALDDPRAARLFSFDLATIDVHWAIAGRDDCGEFNLVAIGGTGFSEYHVTCVNSPSGDITILRPPGLQRVWAGLTDAFFDQCSEEEPPFVQWERTVDVPATGEQLDVVFQP
jgi:hypothetical protein